MIKNLRIRIAFSPRRRSLFKGIKLTDLIKAWPLTIRKCLPREVKIIEISKTEAKRLNQKYYGKDRPANVLSFRYGPDYPVRSRVVQKKHGRYLSMGQRRERSVQKRRKKFFEIFSRGASNGDYGEILICPAFIRREAKEQGNTYKYQMTWMIIHGMLHLAGIHHEDSRKLTKRVEQLEGRILARVAGKENSKFKVQNSKFRYSLRS